MTRKKWLVPLLVGLGGCDVGGVAAPDPPAAQAALLDSLGEVSSVQSPIRSMLAFSSAMVLENPSAFEITLVDRECASPTNTVTVVSPTVQTLSGTMCQEPKGRVWPFHDTYRAGSVIELDFVSGVRGATGQLVVSGSYPEWTIAAEDGADGDFNDFILRCRALPVCRMFETPPGTSLLEHFGVLRMLAELAELSGFDGPPDQRRERIGYVIERDGKIETIIADVVPPLSSCMARPEPAQVEALNQDPSVEIRATVHTHPRPGGQSHEVLPDCWVLDSQGELYLVPEGATVYQPEGPSPEDWSRWDGGTEVPYEGWMMDPEAFWRWYQSGGPIDYDPSFENLELYDGEGACIA